MMLTGRLYEVQEMSFDSLNRSGGGLYTVIYSLIQLQLLVGVTESRFRVGPPMI